MAARIPQAIQALAVLLGTVFALAAPARANEPTPRTTPVAAAATTPRPFVILRDRQRFELTPATATGGFDAVDLAIASQAFAYRNDQSTHAVHARLLDLAYRAMVHFNAPHVVLISGFRRTRVTSRHSHGRAIDFQLPDVNVRELAAFLEQSGFVGVGVYPRSGFVHLDVRGSSYFWVDNSRQGRRGRGRPRRMESAARYDQEARARGEVPDALVVAAEAEEDAVRDTQRERRRQRQRAQPHRGRSRARASRAHHAG